MILPLDVTRKLVLAFYFVTGKFNCNSFRFSQFFCCSCRFQKELISLMTMPGWLYPFRHSVFRHYFVSLFHGLSVGAPLRCFFFFNQVISLIVWFLKLVCLLCLWMICLFIYLIKHVAFHLKHAYCGCFIWLNYLKIIVGIPFANV